MQALENLRTIVAHSSQSVTKQPLRVFYLTLDLLNALQNVDDTPAFTGCSRIVDFTCKIAELIGHEPKHILITIQDSGFVFFLLREARREGNVIEHVLDARR